LWVYYLLANEYTWITDFRYYTKDTLPSQGRVSSPYLPLFLWYAYGLDITRSSILSPAVRDVYGAG
jgi:hypothetical protein